VQADLKTFAAMGVYGTSAVTAVTAQNTLEVRDVVALRPAIVEAQIDAVLSDIGADAVKTGMLADAAIVRAVAHKLREYELQNIVIDPVMLSSTDKSLLDEAGGEALMRELLPLALIATPNTQEASVLSGRKVETWDDARQAARMIVERGAASVVITGGDFIDEDSSTDLYFDGHGFREYTAIRVRTQSTHGTGCTFSAAIAAGIAKGLNVEGAIALAKSYVTLALQHAYPIGHGSGPPHHFYRYWQPRISRQDGITNADARSPTVGSRLTN
jgi:hydroxymethylpyrimidine/phosphomethylpyrimidine kinase